MSVSNPSFITTTTLCGSSLSQASRSKLSYPLLIPSVSHFQLRSVFVILGRCKGRLWEIHLAVLVWDFVEIGVVLLSQVFFSLVLLLLSQWRTPPLRLQVSACSTFLMMCHVPSTTFFCTQYIECCTDIVSRFILTFTFNSHGPNDYWYDKPFHIPHLLNFCT
jgi:hypothetical protein